MTETMTIEKTGRIWCCGLMMLLFTALYGQEGAKEVSISDWRICKEELASGTIQRYLYFDSAFLERHGQHLLPVWHHSIPRPDEGMLRATLSDTRWRPLTEQEKSLLPLDCIDTITAICRVNPVVTRRKPFAEVSVVPFRLHDGRYEKLVAFRLDFKHEPASVLRSFRQKGYAEHSVLSSGEIYRFALNKTGVHKLTYSDLQSMGVPMGSLNIRTISIYGNGGFQLPENTSVEVPDDLQEVPVKVVDRNNNGIFDADDYLLFYARGIVEWKMESTSRFTHTLNIYSDYAYYFVKTGQAPARVVTSLPSVTAAPTHQISSYRYHGLLEEDLISPTGVGRLWFKDAFDAITSRTYTFSLPEKVSGSEVELTLCLAASSPSYSSFFSYVADGGVLESAGFSSGNGQRKTARYRIKPSSSSFTLTLDYSKPSNTSKGWLDYIEVFADCRLKQTSSQIDFRCPASVGEGNVTEYLLETKGTSPVVWDVTDPFNCQEVQTTNNGDGTISFRLPSDKLHEFVSFYGSNLHSVVPLGRVNHQDLHSLEPVDLVIVTHPSFLSAAEQLAQFRRTNDRMRVAVVTTSQVYNEFSSGAQDISAIRNFMKMMYDRYPSDPPRNLLLFGKVSYDFRNRKGVGACFIPNYQASAVFDVDGCLSTDDYFVKLDALEGDDNMGTMDAGVGRIPASNASQASAAVRKLMQYASMELLGGTSYNGVSNLADWRNILTFCADDDADEMGHLFNADRVAENIASVYPVYNIEKIYLDAYKKVSTSQGQRYPEATEALNQRVNKGCLWLTYMGHGGDNGWAHERFLKRSDINSWTNRYCLPIFYAGSCSFGAYDRLSATSPSEDMLFKTDGGAIGVISATRSSYGGTNETFGLRLLQGLMLEDTAGRHLTMGEVFAQAKNRCGMVQMYVLFGDPSMTLAFPKGRVLTDSLNGVTDLQKDTLQALSYVTVSGHVCGSDGLPDRNFNGFVYPTIYDKAATVKTQLNNSNSVENEFRLQKNILYKGKISVENGSFRFGFLMPKDINYDYGFGKISYYAQGGLTDANGYDSLRVGGVCDTLIPDDRGPEIRLFLNDESFVSGGIVGTNPTLLAEIRDDHGVNTAGIGIGHDIVAVLDQNEAERIVLNDYYECEANSSLSGKIRYLLSDLPEGVHSLTLRAWDVLNNRSEATISFNVVEQKELALDHVLNYPNPFTTHTSFYFEHNQINTDIDVCIQVFTVSGRLVRTILHSEYAESFRCGPLEWDGRDDFGGRLAKGTYLYKIRVRTSDGKVCEKLEKLVIL